MKKITDELIDNKLKEQGILHVSNMDQDEMLVKLQAEYDFDIVHEWNQGAQMYFYFESTADGYEVYIASENDSNPYIGQDVYYYESDWFEKLPDAIYDGLTIYIDENAMGEGPFTYAIEEVYEELYETKQTEIINELKDKGYEH
ncbi:MAG: hypothetical protein CBC27_08135 [Opitutia bacterium TMED67]|nr:MAG: hypothetical protein CBC27_08135 [Opitutae bacterium TMED67]